MLQFDTSTDDPSFIVVGSNISKIAEFGSTLDNAYISIYANDPQTNIGYLIGTSNQNLSNPIFSIGMINKTTNSIYPDFTISNHSIGINNPFPSYSLDTVGDVNFTGNLYNNGAKTGLWYNPINYIYTNSNVGIGTTNSLYRLHVIGSTYISGSIYASNLKPSAFIDTTIASNITIGKLPLSTIPTDNVIISPGTYGIASNGIIPQITTDIYGRVLDIQEKTLIINKANIYGLPSVAIYGNYCNLQNIPFYYDPDLTTYYLGNGNIGIGTTNANMAKLHIEGDGYFNGTITASNLNIIGELTTVNVVTSNSRQLDIINSGPGPALKVSQTNGSIVSQFYNNAGPVFTISGEGRIGIGSSIPNVALDIIGNVNITNGTITGGGLVSSAYIDTTLASNIRGTGTLNPDVLALSGVTSGIYGSYSAVPSINIDSKGRIINAVNCNINITSNQVSGLSVVAGTGNYNDLTNKTFILNNTSAYYSIGNVGISTNSPDSLLTIGEGSNDYTSTLKINVGDLQNGKITDRIYLTSFGASNTRLSHSANSNLVLYIGQSNIAGSFHIMSGSGNAVQYQDRITINNTGNVGINNSIPNYTLDISGDLNISNSLYNSNLLIATNGKITERSLPLTTVNRGNYSTVASNVALNIDATGRIVSASNIAIQIGLWQVTGLAASASNDTTNASNIKFGKLSASLLPNTSVIAGNYGIAASNIALNIDATGRIISASNIAIIIPVSSVIGLAASASNDTTNAANIVSGVISSSRLPNTNVNPGNYGNSASNITISVDQYGRLLNVINNPVIIPVKQVTGLSASSSNDTTNANNITSGTLSYNRLPLSGTISGNYSFQSSNILISVNDRGIITSIGSNLIAIDASQVTSGVLDISHLPKTNISNYGQYGDNSTTVQITTDSYGRVTSLVPKTINIPTLSTIARTGDYNDLALNAPFTYNASSALTSYYNGAGTIGIGTTRAAYKLHVEGDIFTSGNLFASNLNILGQLTTINVTTSNATKLNILNITNGPALIVSQTYADTVVQFNAYSGIALNIDKFGNVGIGTDNVNTKLGVAGDIYTSGNITASNLLLVNPISASLLPNTNIIAGNYGSYASNIIFNLDNKGRIISANSIPIIIDVSQVSGINSSATIDTTNANNITSGILSYDRLPITNPGGNINGLGSKTISLTINQQGIIQNASESIIQIDASQIISGNIADILLNTTSVNAGNYSSPSHTLEVTIDQYGRLTNASSVPILIDASQVITGLAPSATIDTTNADNIIYGTLSYDRLPTSGIGITSDVSYGDQSKSISLTINPQGIITNANENLIQIDASQIVSGLSTIARTGDYNDISANAPFIYNPGETATTYYNGYGNIGIGTTNAAYKLHVNGDIYSKGTVYTSNLKILGEVIVLNVTSSNTDRIKVINTAGGPGLVISQVYPDTVAQFYGHSGIALNIDEFGNVGIGTSIVTTKLGVAGDIYTSGNISASNLLLVNPISVKLLPITSVTAGNYGLALGSNVTLNIDNTGRIVSASNVPIQIAVSQVTGLAASATIDTTNANNIKSGILSSNILPTTTVTAGNYGLVLGSNVAINIDSRGRILSASNVPIQIGLWQVTGLVASASNDTTNANNIKSGTLSSNILPTTTVTAGNYGLLFGSNVAINIDSRGRILSASNVPIQIAVSQITGLAASASNDTTNANNIKSGTLSASLLPNTTVTAGNYGLAASNVAINIDSTGRIVSASNVSIQIGLWQVTGLVASASNDTTNANNIKSGTLSASLLPNTTVTAGNYGLAASNVAINIDSTGRIASANNVAIQIGLWQVTGLVASASIDTTNANNIKSGTLSASLLPNTTVTAGNYGLAASNVAINIDSSGRIASASNVAIQIGLWQVTGLAASASNDTTNANNIKTGTLSASLLPNTTVTAGNYGLAASNVAINIDTTGRIVSASNVPIKIGLWQVTDLAASASNDTTNANNIKSGTLSASLLPNTTVTAGNYGLAASNVAINIDSTGRIVSASNVSIQIGLWQVTGLVASASNDTTNANNIKSGTLSASLLPNTTVTAGNYGLAASNVAINIDSTGRIVSASNVAIQIAVTQISGLAASASIDTTNATNIKTGTLSSNLLSTININSVGVYGTANYIPTITVDSYGRVTNVTPTYISLAPDNFPTITTTGTSGGNISGNITTPVISIDQYGRVTSLTNYNLTNYINTQITNNNTTINAQVLSKLQYSSAFNSLTTTSDITYVGIGNNNPSSGYKLDVNGIVNATQFIGDGSRLTGVLTNNQTQSQWTTCNLGIYINSNVVIGQKIYDPNNALNINGNTLINGTLNSTNIVTSNITVINNTFIANDNPIYRSALQTNPITQSFVVSSSTQTIFTLSTATTGRYTASTSNVEIFKNGIKLGFQNNSYTISVLQQSTSTNFTITLTTAAVQNDNIDITIWPQLISTNLTLQPGYVYQQFYDLWSSSNNNIYYNNGNVGIGTSSPVYKLHVTGTIYTTNSVVSFSDISMKKNIITYPNALNTVNKLRGVSYNRKDTDEKQIGVIAQEVLEVIPEVVKETKEGLAVSYGNIVGVLIEAIKELSAEIEQIKKYK